MLKETRIHRAHPSIYGVISLRIIAQAAQLDRDDFRKMKIADDEYYLNSNVAIARNWTEIALCMVLFVIVVFS